MSSLKLFIAAVALLLATGLLSPRIVRAQSLRGSPTSVDRIYRQALRHDLHFYETGSGIRRAVDRGRFVRLRGNSDYVVASVSYPYVLPTTETFVVRLASQYRSACGERLVITSAMRPKSIRLPNSVTKTVHPTGMAIDIRKPRGRRCLSWLRETLLYLEGQGALDAVEERNPPHFHVAVFPDPYRSYVQRRGGSIRIAAAAEEEREAPAGGGTDRTTYRVRRGDSLWAIARRHGMSVTQLQRANEIQSSRIVAGQVLVIPETR